jgi:hypothetical protein
MFTALPNFLRNKAYDMGTQPYNPTHYPLGRGGSRVRVGSERSSYGGIQVFPILFCIHILLRRLYVTFISFATVNIRCLQMLCSVLSKNRFTVYNIRH